MEPGVPARAGPWGSGLGTHVAREAVTAGRATRPAWPVVARSLETNPASGRVSERTGLRLVWQDLLERIRAVG